MLQSDDAAFKPGLPLLRLPTDLAAIQTAADAKSSQPAFLIWPLADQLAEADEPDQGRSPLAGVTGAVHCAGSLPDWLRNAVLAVK